MSRTLAWGILGTGRIAGIFANGVRQSQTGTLTAVGSRSQAAADAFGENWHIPHRYSRYEDVLADQSVQAVYLALPHPFHAEWAIKAAEAGKHVLCEKPIVLNSAEAMAVVEAAQRHADSEGVPPVELLDSLGFFLDEVVEALAGGATVPEERSAAASHALERLSVGFRIDQVVRYCAALFAVSLGGVVLAAYGY